MGKFGGVAPRAWMFLFGWVLLAPGSLFAISHQVELLLDLDDDVGTGCVVSTADGPFAGVEQRLLTQVETAGTGTATVLSVTRSVCDTGTLTFGAPIPVDSTGWPVGVGLGLDGFPAIETYAPLAALAGPGGERLGVIRIGVVNRNELGQESTLLTSDGESGPGALPIKLDLRSVLEIPTLGEWGLIALVALLGLSAVLLLGRRGTLALAIVLVLLAYGVAWAAGQLDGDPSEFGPESLLGEDPLAIQDGTAVRALFGFGTGTAVCFRIDASLTFNSAPTADPQAVATPEDTPVAITLTGTDPESDPLSFSIVPASGPAHGTLTGVAPNVTYTPLANYEGPDAFDFQVQDPSAGTGTATVSITVTGVNDVPVVNPAAFSVAENASVGASVGTVTFTDPDAGQSHTFAITVGNTGGAFAVNTTTGQITVAAPLDFETLASYSLTVEVTDDGTPGLSASATVDVTVTNVDDPPVAVDDSATVTEDDPATTIDVLANDTDVDGGPKSVQSVTQPANGTVVITNGGADLTYQPDADSCNDGTPADTFTYTLNGGSTATVSVTVTCVDDPPVAVDDAANVTEDSGANAIDVLANDTDVDGGPKSVQSVTQPGNGTVVITGGGTGVSYTPDADYCNGGSPLDTFTYTLAPGGSTATVSVTVTCVDDPPVAVDDAATVTEDSGANAIGVLANDTDVDGGPKSVQSVTQPGNGTVVITGGGTGVSYTPNANYCNGSSPTDDFTYTLNGGSSATVAVTVTCVDDPPLAVNDTATVTEDSGANAIDVLLNDTDVDGGTKQVTVVQNPSANGGTVTITGGGSGVAYAPAANYCNDGSPLDTFTYTLNGGSTATVSVTVTCVNDAPVLDLDADDDKGTAGTGFAVTFTEGDGPKLLEDPDDPTGAVITDVDSTTLVSLTVTLTNLLDAGEELLDANVSAFAPAITKDYETTTPGVGVLTISSVTPQPIADYVAVLRTVTYAHTGEAPSSTARIVQFVANDGTSDSNTATSTVTVVPVDDPPVAVADTVTVAEDSGANAVDVLANDTDVDGGPKSVQSVTQPGNGTVAITGGGTGVSYTPAADYCNSPPGTTPDTFSYTLNGGSSTTVAVTVTCVDDPPVAVADAATVTEDSGANPVDVLANDTDVDGGAKSVQSVTQPANGTVVITGGGTGVTYAPNPNYCNSPPGTTLDTFGYTLNGGSSATVSVTVTCVDDPPTAVADAATVTEDSGASAIDVLANDTDVDGGPIAVASVTQPANGTVVITGGGTGVTYAPGTNYCNSLSGPSASPDTFTYTLSPGGSSASVSVTVICVNDPPVAGADTYDFVGNTELRVDLAASATPHLLETTGSGFGVLDNDADPVENDPIFVAGIVGCADLTAPFDCTIAGVGAVTMESNGRFDFVPEPGDSDASESFQYTLSDGTDTVVATVTLNRTARVWYVDNSTATAGVDGTSVDPFDTLAEAQTASSANDYVFVRYGDGTTTGQNAGITLKSGQHLLGEHVGLSLPVSLNGNGSPTVLFAAVPGNRPAVGDATAGAPEGVSAIDAIPAEVAGLSLSGNVNAIEWTTTAPFAGSGTLDVHDNVVTGAGGIGVDVNLAGTGATRLSFHDNLLTATGTALNVQETGAGTLTITAFDDNVVSGDTGGHGMVIANAIFDAVPGGGFDLVSGGTTAIGAPGNGVGLGGVLMSGVSGDLLFTDLDVFAGNGSGIQVAGTGASNLGAGTGMRFRVGAGVGVVSATGGPAVDLSNLTADLQLATLTSTNTTSRGVRLDAVADGGGTNATFSAGSGSAITTAAGASGPAFQVNGGNAKVTYAGTITNNSSAARAVSLTSWAGDDATDDLVLSGAIDENGAGILVSGNSGARAITFSGGLDVDTTTGEGFAATSNTNALGLAVTGSANDIDSVSATALRVTNTTIGSSNLNFRHVSSGNNTGAADPAAGIVLTNTGTLGGLKITGTGAAGSGGTIQHATSTGISLTGTRNVELAWMQLDDFGDYAIRGDSVVGFDLSNTVINGVNGNDAAADEGSVRFTELTGSAAITNVDVSGAVENNFRVVNTSGTLDRITFTGSTFGPMSTTTGNDGLVLESLGTAVIKATVQASFFTHAAGDLFNFLNNGSATNDLVFTGNALSNAHPAIATGGGGVTISGGDNGGGLTFAISGNTFRDADGHAVLIVKSTGSGTYTGTFANNVIGVQAVPNSGSVAGSGLKVQNAGQGAVTIAITGNTIRNYNNYGIELLTGGGASAQSGALNATVTGNTVGTPGTGGLPMNGIHLNGGTVPGDTYAICLDVGGAGALANSIAGSGANLGTDIRLRQRQSTTVQLRGYTGGATDTTAVQSYLITQNSGNGAPTALASVNSPPGGGFVNTSGGGACPQP